MRNVVVVLLTLGALPAHAGKPDPVTLSQGRELLRTFEAQLKRRDTENGALIATLDRLIQAYETLAPDPFPEDNSAELKRAYAKRFEAAAKSFRRKAEAALLRAVKVKRVDPDLKRNERHPVTVRAVRALRRTRPEVAKRIRHLLEHTIIKDRDYEPYGVFYDEAFATLVRLDPDGSFDWLLEECVTTDIRHGPKARTLAALDALMNIRKVPGRKRRRVVQKIVFQWEVVEGMAFYGDYGDAAGNRGRGHVVWVPMLEFWRDLRLPILAVMRHFGTDPRTGAVPLDPRTGMTMTRLFQYTRWYSRHKRLERPPWLDPKEDSYVTPHTRARAAGVTIGRDHILPWWAWWIHNREIARRARQGTAPRSAAVTDRKPSFRRCRVRKEIIPVLRKAMSRDEDPEVRAAAAIALGRLKAGEAKAELLFFLHDDRSPAMREAAALGLVGLSEKSVRPYLEDLARNRNVGRYLRAYAVLGLAPVDTGAFKGPRLVLSDLQAYAVLGTGVRAGGDGAFDLASLLGQRRVPADARGQVGPALARLGNRKVVPVLHDFLRKNRGRKRELSAPAVGVAIAMGALIEEEDEKTIELIVRAGRRPREWPPAARVHFVIALGQIGGELAYRRLVEGYKDARKDRRRYAEAGYYLLAAGLTGRKEARSFVRAQFRELKHEEDLAACAIALALLGDKGMAAQLRTTLEASRNEFVPHGMIALAMLGDEKVLPLIRHFVTRHRGPLVFSEGVLALAILRGNEALPQLLELFEWARSRDQLRAAGRALSLVESEEAVARLLAIHGDATRRPELRAAALEALGRIGAGEKNLFAKIARDVNMHATSPTLPALAMLR